MITLHLHLFIFLYFNVFVVSLFRKQSQESTRADCLKIMFVHREHREPSHPFNVIAHVGSDRAEKRLRMRHLRAVGGSSAGKSRLEQKISNVKSIVER